jgi:acyl-CoA thioester hydrolase
VIPAEGSGRRRFAAPPNAATVYVPIRFGDIDGYGHVNNVEYARILEEARIKVFWVSQGVGGPRDGGERRFGVVDARPGAGTQTLVAAQTVEYIAPILYQDDPIPVDVWIAKASGATMCVDYVVRGDGAAPTVYAVAETVLAFVDAATGAPRRLTKLERDTWAELAGPRVRFSPR